MSAAAHSQREPENGAPDAEPVRLPIAPARAVASEIGSLLEGRRPQLLLLVLTYLGGAAAGLVVPRILGAIVDAVLAGEDPSRVWLFAALMLAAASVSGVLLGAGVMLSARVFARVLADLRERFVARALALPQHRVEEAGSGDLVSRSSDDVAQVSESISEVLPAFCWSAFTVLVSVAGLAVLDLRYGLAILLIVPIHVLALRWYMRNAPQVYTAERAAIAARAHELLANVHGRGTVWTYGLSAWAGARIAARSWVAARWSLQARIVQNRFFARLNLAEFIGVTSLLVCAFLLVSSDSGSVGQATSALLFFLALFGPMNQLLFVIDQLQSALASLSRIVGVIRAQEDAEPGPHDPPAAAPHDAPAALEFEAVRFGYPGGRTILRELSVRIEPGTTVALVGGSGAGKSTLAALAVGILRPDAGHVRAGGRSLSELDDTERARLVAMVAQEVHTFAGTLRENVTIAAPHRAGAHEVEEADPVEDALERAGALEWARSLANGLETVIGERGRRLTAAEAQRLALARIAIAAPAVSILDEATADAGSTAARSLEEAASRVLEGRTALIVAHRLSQAESADRILVMEDGEIVEDGAHAELLERGGRYAQLWRAWSARGVR